jgi:probable HAF family extracellular repeat protein
MKQFFFWMGLPIRMAARIGLAMIALAAYAQTGAHSSILVVERSAIAQRLAHELAPKGALIVTLDTAAGVVSPENSIGANESPAAQQTGADNSTAALKTKSVAFAWDGRPKRYFITDLGTLGGTQSVAYAVNDFGQVVGASLIAGDEENHSFLYSNGKMRDLYPLNSQSLQTEGPTGINNLGQIASGLIVDGVYVPAIFKSITGHLTLIGSLGGVTSYGFNGVATAINNRGDAVGYSYIDSNNRHAFLYNNRTNLIRDIGSFGGYSEASAINDAGVIVGFASDQFNGVAHAFMYADGAITDIHPSTESYATDVNIWGQVVGQFLTADQSAFHAFLYSRGTFTDLGSAGSGETDALAINDWGAIVGVASTANEQHAFIYKNGKMNDLNALIPPGSGWELTYAFDVNNLGQIAGSGLVNDKFRAFLLTPAIGAWQCLGAGWKNFGFKNQGQCIQYVNTGK